MDELIERAWQIRGDKRLDAFREARWLITDLLARITELEREKAQADAWKNRPPPAPGSRD